MQFPSSTLVEELGRQVAETPEGVALKDGARTLTYRELDRASNRVAHALLARAAGEQEPVAAALRRHLPRDGSSAAVGPSGGAVWPPRSMDAAMVAGPLVSPRTKGRA